MRAAEHPMTMAEKSTGVWYFTKMRVNQKTMFIVYIAQTGDVTLCDMCRGT